MKKKNWRPEEIEAFIRRGNRMLDKHNVVMRKKAQREAMSIIEFLRDEHLDLALHAKSLAVAVNNTDENRLEVLDYLMGKGLVGKVLSRHKKSKETK